MRAVLVSLAPPDSVPFNPAYCYSKTIVKLVVNLDAAIVCKTALCPVSVEVIVVIIILQVFLFFAAPACCS